jgi:hypothetical protein
MAVILVTYDLKAPGRDYASVYSYLRKYTYCKNMDSVWLLDTSATCKQIRDDLKALVDAGDKVFVSKLAVKTWASYNVGTMGSWLNEDSRTWT